jgi:hypothetical protein
MSTPKFDVLEAGFYFLTVLKRRPGACLWVLFWSGVPLILLILAIMQVMRAAVVDGSTELPPTFVPLFIVCWFAMLAAMLSTYGAWLRLMVRDELAPVIPLRFGADEWRLLGSMFAILGVYFLVLLGMLIVIVPGSLLSRGFDVGTPAHILLNVLSVAATVPLFIWFAVRVYPTLAMSVLDRRTKRLGGDEGRLLACARLTSPPGHRVRADAAGLRHIPDAALRSPRDGH